MPVRSHVDELTLFDSVEKLSELLRLREAIDSSIEEGMLRRENLAEVLQRMLPAVCERIGAAGAFVESYGEDLEIHVFEWPHGLTMPERREIFARTRVERRERVEASDDAYFAVA